MTPDQFLLSRGAIAAAASRAWWRTPASRRRLDQLAMDYFAAAREAKKMRRTLDELVAEEQAQAFAAEYAAFVPPLRGEHAVALADLMRVCRDHAEQRRV